MTAMYFERFDTPIGILTIAADAKGLRHIEFPSNRHPVDRAYWQSGAQGKCAEILIATRMQLNEYFAGARKTFDLPLAPEGTLFQCEVWRTLATIPFGETWSYRDLARAIGKPDAMRAVGAANGRNPLPIVLPCHRVIGADGRLVGFGGGLPIKTALLRLEGAQFLESEDETAVSATGDLFG
ncbi:MAG: methylated-DNA--[protein]-cysteine S-methyltransferase [Lysobacter sp.]|nr:MAG: methylated-DNA--[protein]-cysteine S-methyltransferase [Lysobacter sp.]